MLERWLNHDPVPHHLRVPLAASHLEANSNSKLSATPQDKLYVKASSTANVVLVGFDVDSHNGETDVAATMTWITQNYLLGMYVEDSDRGCHGYLRLDLEGNPPAELREVINPLNRLFSLEAARRGFRASVDGFKGLPVITCQGGGRLTVANRGTLVRAPVFPDQSAGLNRLLDSATLTFTKLKLLLRSFGTQLAAKKAVVPKVRPKEAIGVLDRVIYRGGVTNASHHPPIPPHESLCSLSAVCLPGETLAKWLARLPPDVVSRYERGRSRPLPDGRMLAALNLARFGRPDACDDPVALVAFYEWLGFASGPAAGNTRLERAKNAIAFSSRNRKFELGEWLPIIQQFVTPVVRSDPRVWGLSSPPANANIPDESLAAMLCVYTWNTLRVNANPAQQFATADIQVAKYLRALCSEGAIESPLGKKQYRRAALRMLELSGLLSRREFHWRPLPGRKGVGTKFNLGSNHPQREKFTAFCHRLGVPPDITIPPIPPLTPKEGDTPTCEHEKTPQPSHRKDGWQGNCTGKDSRP